MSKIHFIKNLSDFSFASLFENYSKVVVFVDDNTEKHCYLHLKPLLGNHNFTVIKHGEEQKTLETCKILWEFMTNESLDRKSLVINLGGGVLGDMGGFCAATYKRGIDFVQIPTTLLSQVDASVGGKLGIDFQDFKNHIGVFQEPVDVIVYPGFLQTLDKRELRSGFSEIIKHSLIKDAAHWQTVKKINLQALYSLDFDVNAIIQHSIAIKSAVVTADPTEKGLRKILNFGHTLGHAIESFYLPHPTKKLLHGEAIAIGMICEAFLSVDKKLISKSDFEDITNYILSIYGKVNIDKADFEHIIPLTLQDKKNSHGSVNFSLLNQIGNCLFDIKINAKEMEAVLLNYIDL